MHGSKVLRHGGRREIRAVLAIQIVATSYKDGIQGELFVHQAFLIDNHLSYRIHKFIPKNLHNWESKRHEFLEIAQAVSSGIVSCQPFFAIIGWVSNLNILRRKYI